MRSELRARGLRAQRTNVLFFLFIFFFNSFLVFHRRCSVSVLLSCLPAKKPRFRDQLSALRPHHNTGRSRKSEIIKSEDVQLYGIVRK